jgi:hypothetical protein
MSWSRPPGSTAMRVPVQLWNHARVLLPHEYENPDPGWWKNPHFANETQIDVRMLVTDSTVGDM